MVATSAEAGRKKDLRYYSLDFWRGVACLMVVVFHSLDYIVENPAHTTESPIARKIFSLLSQGWAGVPLFFVISGYCIAAACEGMGIKGASMRIYFFRRFKRIFPPYWVLLLGLIALHIVPQLFGRADFLADDVVPLVKPAALSAWQWLGNVTLTEGWREHFIGDKSCLFLTPAWTLGYEEQFYAVCGVAILLGRKRFYPFLGVLSALVLAIVVISNAVFPLPVDGFFFDGRWLMFAAGVLVFYVIQFGGDRARKRALTLFAVGFCAALAWGHFGHARIGLEMACSFAFAGLLLPLYRFDRQIIMAPVFRPIAVCGLMCYSLYLIHWPIVKLISQAFYRSGVQSEWATLFITIPVAVLTAVSLAWGFHLVVERKFMNTPPSLPQPAKPSTVEAQHPTSMSTADGTAKQKA
jgi:peptidoglycan/LPS O-acetylase OafA/YrhL